MGKQPQPRQRLNHQPVRPTPAPHPLSNSEASKVGLTSRFGLLAVLLVFLSLTTLHSLIVPITQGEDELAHYRYISFIAQKGRLPIDYAERKQAWYRADWPPLYHLLVSWAVSLLDTTRPHLKDVGESPRRRLVGEIFYPRLIIYTEDANWPWQDGILAWHVGRFISIIFSAGALVFTYFTVLEMGRGCEEAKTRRNQAQEPTTVASSPPVSSSHLLALAVTALLAFTPRYLFTSAMLGDDSLFVLLSASFIWLLLRVVRGDDRWWLYAAMGFLLGLSVVTKYSTGLLPLVIIPVVVWQARQASWPGSKALSRVALTWIFTLIGVSWWFGWIGYYFNTIKEEGLIFGLLKPLLASGPDVSMRRIFAVFSGGEFTGQERPAAIEVGTFWGWLTYLFQTFWGVPVLEHDPLFPWAYLLMFLFCLLALIGLWQLWQTVSGEMRVILGVLALIVILLLLFPILRFFLTRNILETGQGRHILYPAAQAIPILLVLGWARISEWVNTLSGTGQRMANTLPGTSERMASQRASESANGKTSRFTLHASRFTLHAPRFTPHASHLLFTPTILVLLWSIFQLFYMALVYPAPLPVRTTTFSPASIPQPLKHNFGDAIQLLGYDFVPDAEQSIINLTLFWRSLKAVDENYRTQIQLVDAAGQPHFTWLSHPLNGRYPTRAWDEGDVIRDTLPLPLAAVPPNTYSLQLNLLREAEDTPLADSADGQSSEPFQFIQIPLATKPPLAKASNLDQAIDYRLWLDDKPARHRQTLPLSWTYSPPSPLSPLTWALVGPDGTPRSPAATSDATAIFIVGADWPSGAYHLQAEAGAASYQTEPLLTVANEARLFELPPLPEGWIPVEANFANQVKLLGYSLPARRVEPGGGLPLTLYWQSLAPVLGDYVVFDKLLAENQQAYGGYDRLPREYYSTILWAEGEVVEDGFAVPVAPNAPPGVYNLRVGLYSLKNGSPVSLPLVEDGQPTAVTSVVIGPVKVGGPPAGVTSENPTPQVKLNQTLGNQITLLGYDLDQSSLENCQLPTGGLWLSIVNCQLSIRLYWRAEVIPSADYTTFLHLRNAANRTVAQKDNPPAAGRYPTSLWDAGEIIVDEISLPLTDKVPPGRYIPVIGLYNLTTGERLAGPANPAQILSGTGEIALEPVEIP